jgi:microcystin-dependent protein
MNINIEKISIIILVMFVIYLFIQQRQTEEQMANTDVSALDISAIKTLSDISQALLNGGLTVPGNITTTGDLNVSGKSNLMPKGCIVAWSGAVDKIPATWALCDGKTNDTPNLVDKFILGNNVIIVDEKLKIGGAKSVTLTLANMPPHTHGGNTSSNGSHSHGINKGSGRDNDGTTNVQFLSNNNGSIQISAGGEHGHTITTDTGQGCAGVPFDIMPPYYKLCYIMKL